ncbi:response regulator [Pseudobacteriovorax antillogorgiicola]|uniref:Regulatory protein, luxR family n=1 Tax=Pseudobacteriovorax antillogorgiicola TaxID=1513793 RepID=A0A1Y6CDB4_9BACT|nr:response regulator [Pseudobacteriovorax antillogorgiicola]TCS51690.1 regulatory LuxR family protein [Pseudobacteriovorax antillogorgiicola]SMF49106.1 regulatory protein, luxR family [Pseudobacteriovorax antillogorgiicola]
MSTAPVMDLKGLDELKEPLEAFVAKHGLSKREHDVLALLVHQVVSAENISEHLGISRNTVRIHLKNINTKVGTTSKSELLGKFIEFVIQQREIGSEEVTETDLLILIADDDDSYVDLVRKASESAIGSDIKFRHVSDGHQMIEYLEGTKRNDPSCKRPHIILLDLNMPKMNGFQALERLKTDPQLNEIPVVVFTSSSTQADVSNIYALGGNSYVTKPGGYQQLKQVMHGIVSYWGRIGALPSHKS